LAGFVVAAVVAVAAAAVDPAAGGCWAVGPVMSPA